MRDTGCETPVMTPGLSPTVSAALGAGATLAGGFGMMTTFWYALPRDDALPGHWDYPSGTIGDAILLPMVVGSLILMVRALPRCPWDRTAVLTGSAAGLLAGAVEQYLWLADSNPRLNWVLPAPGSFSLPGWYHAAFLVVTSAMMTGLFSVLLVRLRSAPLERPEPRRFRWLVAVFSATVTVFLSLVILDSLPSIATSSSRATVALCVTALVVPIAALTRARPAGFSHLLAPQLNGAVAALALVGITAMLVSGRD